MVTGEGEIAFGVVDGSARFRPVVFPANPDLVALLQGDHFFQVIQVIDLYDLAIGHADEEALQAALARAGRKQANDFAIDLHEKIGDFIRKIFGS